METQLTRISKEAHRKAKIEAAKEGKTLIQWINEAIKEKAKKQTQK